MAFTCGPGADGFTPVSVVGVAEKKLTEDQGVSARARWAHFAHSPPGSCHACRVVTFPHGKPPSRERTSYASGRAYPEDRVDTWTDRTTRRYRRPSRAPGRGGRAARRRAAGARGSRRRAADPERSEQVQQHEA